MKKKYWWTIRTAVVIGAVLILYLSYPFITFIWTCNELNKEMESEYNKLDYSCQTDEDCELKPIGCGRCVNKNYNTDRYEEIWNIVNDKCLGAQSMSCAIVNCGCLNNKCSN